MRKVIVCVLLLVGGLYSCSSDVETETVLVPETLDDIIERRWQEVVALEKTILDSAQNASPQQSEELLLVAAAFANEYRDNEHAPEALSMTIRGAQGLGEWHVAVDYFDRIIREYPDYAHLEECYYQKAFLLDYHLQDQHRATIAYEEFIAKYPNSIHTQKVKDRMAMNLSMPSDTSLIHLFEEKNEQLTDSLGTVIYGT